MDRIRRVSIDKVLQGTGNGIKRMLDQEMEIQPKNRRIEENEKEPHVRVRRKSFNGPFNHYQNINDENINHEIVGRRNRSNSISMIHGFNNITTNNSNEQEEEKERENMLMDDNPIDTLVIDDINTNINVLGPPSAPPLPLPLLLSPKCNLNTENINEEDTRFTHHNTQLTNLNSIQLKSKSANHFNLNALETIQDENNPNVNLNNNDHIELVINNINNGIVNRSDISNIQ